MSEHDIGELAHGDENRCVFTVHANGNWGDYRCELTVEHSGPHAIGLRHHAVPLIIALENRLKIINGLADSLRTLLNEMPISK